MRGVALLLPLLLLVITLTASSVGDRNLPSPLTDEMLGLIAFKSGLHDPNDALSSWSVDSSSSTTTPCNWAHVQCDPSSSHVLRLSLDSLSLSGHLPRGLDHLPSLTSLSFSHNSLSGPLSSDLFLLSRLTTLSLSHNALSGPLPDVPLPSLIRSLDLSSNSLSGPLPASLFSSAACSSLLYLDLSANSLSGPIPSTLPQCAFLLHLNLSGNTLSGGFASALTPLSALRVLDLSSNSLSGPVPDSIASLHNLETLRLTGNAFSGAVPAGIGLCGHLNSLDLSHNVFNGAIPSSIQSLTSLAFLGLSNSKLSGEIPSWVGNLTALEQLDMSDNVLVGDIPVTLARCTKLSEVRLKGNSLTGSIPDALFGLELNVLDLSSNNLTGRIPTGSTKLAETIQELDLSNNGLTGGIPAEVALYFNLRYLNLSWNNLHSRLPPELGYFRNLSVLDIRSSMLYGSIPGDLCESGSLAVLQLDGNALTGPIPAEIGNCSSLYLLSLSRNGLNGSIPAAMGKLKKLKILKLEFNGLSGELPQQLGGLGDLLVVNISHNRLVGRLPVGGIFPSLDQSSLQDNLGLCSPMVSEPCKMDDIPKPLVLDPNAYGGPGSSNGGEEGIGNQPVPMTTNPLSSRQHRMLLSVSAIIAISAALVIAIGVLVVSLLNVSVRQRIGLIENAAESMCSSSTNSAGPSQAAVGKIVLFGPKSNIRAEDLAGGAAESLLSKAAEIGRGAFGTVYKASISEDRIVAVKKLVTSNTVHSHDEFERDIRILAKARHPNLMPLKGYYWTPQLQLLVSDYAPNGSLKARLHDNSMPPLSWADRFKIASGTAKGLAHLHQCYRPPIVHYNVKPSNILLAEDYNPMVSDFGLAKLLRKIEMHVMNSSFQGGAGYMAPELACQSLRANEKCDVYGFGAVVLELVTGRKAVEYGEDVVVVLMDEVTVLLEQGNVMDCVDPTMGEFPEDEVLPVLKLGLVCMSQVPSSRPSMAEVMQILQVIKAPVPVRTGNSRLI